jgi:NAD(P)-dependent dehydrogenase (short-subunit alcohol dehydrogenase family)
MQRATSSFEISRQNSLLNEATLSRNGPLPVFRLQDRVALITGGGGKIAVEAARRILREGGKVCLVDISAAHLQTAVKILKGTLATGQAPHSRIHTIVADVTVEAHVEDAVKKTVIAFGRLDTAFLNAGTTPTSTSLFDTTEEDYERIMRVNVKTGEYSLIEYIHIVTDGYAAFLGLKHCAAAMVSLGKGGSIILTSSVAGLQGQPGLILYSSAKFALRGLAQTAAEELGRHLIRVNTIHPSGVDGPVSQDDYTSEELDEMKQDIPLERFARADDVASVVAFLASEDSKFMTGGLLKIDGGSTSAMKSYGTHAERELPITPLK